MAGDQVRSVLGRASWSAFDRLLEPFLREIAVAEEALPDEGGNSAPLAAVDAQQCE
jgi:hypothetical protein